MAVAAGGLHVDFTTNSASFTRAQVFKEQIKQETIGAVVELMNSGGVVSRAAGRR